MNGMKLKAAAIAVMVGACVSACGKSVSVGDANDPAKNATPPDPTANCAKTAQWRFVQPDPVDHRVVDLLFVVDTSPSMDPKRSGIADTIPAFVTQLAAGTDFRVAVMLAHGGASVDSGRLYSNPGVPSVLSSASMSVPQIQSALTTNLKYVDDDVDEANGEAGMYSLMQSLKPDRVTEIQRAGFYRPEAALSVVFVTDENDICFPPQLNGYTQFPDFVPSVGGIEDIAFDKYCKAPGQTASNYPDIVYHQLLSFKGSRPVTPAGIVHLDPSKVPQGLGIEDSIGHGITELTHKSANGVLIDIADSSYAAGLTQLGNVVQSTLNLQTRFGLSGTQAIQAGSVAVSVDGVPVTAQFDPANRSVEITAAQAGQSRSVVQVRACIAP